MDDMANEEESINSDAITLYESVNKEKVKAQIFDVRGYRVMLDKDIAAYFGVTTGNLNKAMKRNIKRFPKSFCFQLTREEYLKILRFQFGILELDQGQYSKYLPYVYTEQGVAMLTSALPTDRAIEASIQIIEAFVEMSHYLKQNHQLLPYLHNLSNAGFGFPSPPKRSGASVRPGTGKSFFQLMRSVIPQRTTSFKIPAFASFLKHSKISA